MKTQYYYPTLDCLSSDLFQKLTSKDLRVLNQLFMLFRVAKKDITVKHAYIQPSELWIKSKTGHSISGISRTITRLTQLNIIRCTHRRKKWGKWQTNLYHLGDVVLQVVPWLRKHLKKKESSPFDQKSKLDDINSPNELSDTQCLISFSEWKALSGWKGT